MWVRILPPNPKLKVFMGKHVSDRKEYMREYQRKWIAKRRADWFANKSCVNCSSKESLEIHHLNPEEKISNHVWSWAKERREAELAKCQILCYDCHLEETKKQIQKRYPIKHGEYSGYSRGCRCEACHSAMLKMFRRRRVIDGKRVWKAKPA